MAPFPLFIFMLKVASLYRPLLGYLHGVSGQCFTAERRRYLHWNDYTIYPRDTGWAEMGVGGVERGDGKVKGRDRQTDRQTESERYR